MSSISYSVLTAVSWAFTALAVLLTGGRFWIRCKIIKKISWDDAAHLIGLLLLVAQVSLLSAAASLLYRIAKSEAGDDSHFEDGHLIFVRLNIAGIISTWCCLYAIKTSFLLLYHRIFQISEKFIRAWWTVLAIVILTFLILIAGSLTTCGSPLALEHAESCFAPSMIHRQRVFVIYGCALNVLSDLAIMALPLAMLKGLQMRTPVKVGLAGVFCCAFITIVFEILRAVKTDTEGAVQGSTALWTNLESAVAVIVSCLPSFTALFSPKNQRNDCKNRSPHKQRSLVISDSANLCMGAGSSMSSGYSGHVPAAGESEKNLVTASGGLSAPVADDSRCKQSSIV